MIGKLAVRILLFGGSAVAMAQPAITVKSLIDEEPRLHLGLPGTLEFARGLAGAQFDYVRRVTALHSYSVALLNDTDQDLIAYRLRWSGKDAAGKEKRWSRTEFTFTSGVPDGRAELAAHGADVIMPGDLFAIVTPGPWDGVKQKALDGQLTALGQVRNFTVTLEAVVFSDGRAVGRDPDNWVPRWKAYLDAGRELAHLLAKPDEQVGTGLEQMVKAGVEAGADRVYRAPTYEDAFIATRTQLARTQLALMDTVGDHEQLRRLRRFAEGKAFPRIHRGPADAASDPAVR